jgi:glycosyltransferase involved in cell wall biosynthesis
MDSSDTSKSYDAYYFAHGCGRPYQRDEEWLRFFASIAERIGRDINPGTVLDAGCAMGFLVEALRDLGVDAEGLDISEYAIERVRADIRRYCWVGSLVDPLPRSYDLIVSIEVLEHLSPQDCEQAVRNFCQHTDDILFSSTPFDYKEPTHLNVQPPEYWAQLFARHSFFRDMDFDASFLTPWARRFRRTRASFARIVADYERRLWQLDQENQARRQRTVEQRDELALKQREIESLSSELAQREQVEQSPSAPLAELLENSLQLFWYSDEGFSQTNSVTETLITDGQPHQYLVQFPSTARGPFRLDPGDQASYVEIHHIALYPDNPDIADEAEALATWSVENSFANISAGQGVVPLKVQNCFRFICTNEDPQLLLGGIPGREDDKPWVLRVTMNVSRDFQEIISRELFSLKQSAESEQALKAQMADQQLSLQSLKAQFKTEQQGLVQQIHDKGIVVEKLQVQLNKQEEVMRSLKAQFDVEREELVRQFKDKGIAVEILQAKLIEQGEALQSLESQLQAQLVQQEQALQSMEAERLSERQQLMQQLAQKKVETHSLSIQLQAKSDELNRITRTLGWRLLSRYGPIKYRFVLPAYNRFVRLLGWHPQSKSDQTTSTPDVPHVEVKPEPSYESWARLCEEFRYDREKALSNIEQFRYKPVISILMPVYNTPIPYLRKAIDSVLSQYYLNWELCICDDASTEETVRQVLEEYIAADSRIKVAFSKENHGIAIASNRALELATGEFIGLLDHDDELTPDSLYEVVSTLQIVDADLIYSDEDKRDEEGRRCEPFFKPAWSPDLLYSYMYLCHFSVYRKSVVDRLGGFREGYDGSQDYDLALRFTETTNKIAHIPKILYHWRKVPASTSATITAKPEAFLAAQKALADALHRRNIAGEVEINPDYGYYRIRREIVSPGKVTIIIPTRDRLSLLRRCIDSIESATDYKNYEIVIVDNGSEESETLGYLKHTPHRVIRDKGEFNFSRLNNLAARQSDGEYLLLMNNDTEVIAGEWLSAMVEHAQRPDVGAVGAKLLYPDGRIQHAGVVIGLGGVAGHSHKFADGFRGTGYAHFPNLIRNYGAVTAACLMIRREVFNEMGGLNEQELAVAFNDVDLCLRLRKRGYLIVYTPYALLYHHESASRGYDLDRKEVQYMMAKWRQELMSDPYYNPNLSLLVEDFGVDYSKPEWLYCVFAHILADGVVENLNRQRSVGQEFFTSENKLSAISVRFGTNRSLVKGTVRLHLRESHKARRDIAVVESDASAISDNEYHLFLFDPIEDSGGKRYYFYIEFIEASPTETLTIWKRTITSNEAGPLFENHQPSQGTLSFKVFCDKQIFRYNSGSDLLSLIADRT